MLILVASLLEAAPHLLPYVPLKPKQPIKFSTVTIQNETYFDIDLNSEVDWEKIKPFWLRKPSLRIEHQGKTLHYTLWNAPTAHNTYRVYRGHILLPQANYSNLSFFIPREFPFAWILWLAALLCSLPALCRKQGATSSAREKTLALCILLATIVIQVLPWLAEYHVCPDTGSYISSSSRPFAYPLFIDIVTDADCYREAGLPFNTTMTSTSGCGKSMLTIVQAQYALCIAGLMALGWALMLHVPAVVSVLALTFLNSTNLILVRPWMNTVLSEPFALAWTLAFAAALLAHAATKKFPWLIAAFASAATAYWTRPAGLYLTLALGIYALLQAIRGYTRWRQVIFIFILVPLLTLPDAFSHKAEEDSQAVRYLLAYAMEVSGPEHTQYMPTPTSRRYYEIMLQERGRIQQEKEQSRIPPGATRFIEFGNLDMYFYSVYSTAIRSMKKEGILPAKAGKKAINALLWETYFALLKYNMPAILALHRDTFLVGLGIGDFWQVTRLNPSWCPYWMWLPLAVILLFLQRGPVVALAVSFLGAHYAHMLIVALFNVPRTRYASASEWFVLLSILIMLVGLADRLHEVIGRRQHH